LSEKYTIKNKYGTPLGCTSKNKNRAIQIETEDSSMNKHLRLLQIATYAISGIIHVSGFLKLGEYDVFIGIIYIFIAGWYLLSFHFSKIKLKENYILVVVEKHYNELYIIRKVILIGTIVYFLFNHLILVFTLVPLILSLLLSIFYSYKTVIKITKTHIYTGSGAKINFRNIFAMDISPNHIYISVNNDSEKEHIIDLTKVSPTERALVISNLTNWKASAANQLLY
jgi:hypothetical protein